MNNFTPANIRTLKKFYGNIFNVASASEDDLQKDILSYLTTIEKLTERIQVLEGENK